MITDWWNYIKLGIVICEMKTPLPELNSYYLHGATTLCEHTASCDLLNMFVVCMYVCVLDPEANYNGTRVYVK